MTIPADIHRCDVAIAGGGPVGLTLALALARRGVEVALADAGAPPGEGPADSRAYFIAYGCWRIFRALVLEVWVERLDAHGRVDLGRSLGLAFARLLAGAWADGPDEVAQRLVVGASLVQRAQQDTLLRALARVVRVHERLQAAHDRLAREGFGDPRYEEAQLVLEMHAELLRPQQRELTALVKRLTGRIG